MGFGMSGGLMVGRVGPCILFGRRHWASLPKRGDEEDRVRKVDGIAWVNGLVRMELIWGERESSEVRNRISLFAYYSALFWNQH